MWSVALCLFTIQAALSLILLLSRPLAGAEPVSITGPSMTGTFSLGALVFAEVGETPHVGDIITFRGANGELVTHRIIADSTQGFVTKGDANATADPTPVPAATVIGVVHHTVPLVGYGEIFLTSIPLRIVMYGPLLLLLLFAPVKRRPETGARRAGAGEGRHRREGVRVAA